MEKSIMRQTAEHIELERQEAEERNMIDEQMGMVDVVCPVCSKSFIPAVYHSYKDTKGRLVCTYSCTLNDPGKSKKKKRRYVKWGY